MRKILVVFLVAQFYFLSNGLAQKITIRTSIEEIDDSLIVKVYPDDIELFRDKSKAFFLQEKMTKNYNNFFILFDFSLSEDGYFLEAQSQFLTYKKKQIIKKYVDLILKDTHWNISVLKTSLNCDLNKKKGVYFFSLFIDMNNEKKLKIGLVPLSCKNSPHYYIL